MKTFKITKEQLHKADRKALREIELELNQTIITVQATILYKKLEELRSTSRDKERK